MPYCPKCKVILSPGSDLCPLCLGKPTDGPIPEIGPGAPIAERVRDEEVDGNLTPKRRRVMAVELLAVSFGIALAVCLAADLVYFRAITWARYTSLSIVALWLSFSIPLIFWDRPALIAAALAPSLGVVPFLWGLFAGDLSWYLPVGLPVTIILFGTIAGSYALIAIQRRHGLNAVGIVLAAIGLVCVGVDGSLRFYWTGAVSLTWSIVIIMIVVPVSGLFFYLHYRFMKRLTLKKLFRL